MGKKGGKRASMAFLFTTGALLLVVLVSLSFASLADAGRRPPPPKKPITYVFPTPPKKSPPPVPKKPPHYVAYKPLKKPLKPKTPPPPYQPDLTSANLGLSPRDLKNFGDLIGAITGLVPPAKPKLPPTHN
ncbi:extensin-3-like [Papaver somniferum]|uniref:extensin-3-like n=1 Tax=Papaver somniferum TaxID=3469 RepID=UPI000E6FFDEB|nr:extensin-3-like [Papaver somniferum]XP_026456071.1 extensin-3-like [Papaver somniferum]